MQVSRNVVVYGFHESSLVAAVSQLEREGLWRVQYWIGVNSADKIFDADILDWHLTGLHPAFENVGLPLRINGDDLESSRAQLALTSSESAQLADQLSRNPYCQNFSANDYANLAARLMDRFVRLLRDRAADLVLFQNLPHEGFELALYFAAKKLDIETVLTYQSIIPNRFFYCRDLLDFGWFRTATEISDTTEARLEPTHHKELFYMRDVCTALASQRKPTVAERIRRQVLLSKIRFKLLKLRLGWYRLLRQPPPRIPLEQRYAFELSRATVARIDWSVPFVYFPLHLQPELTTSAIGDRYSDQLTAIEELGSWLPRTWKIFVKENPKQSYRYREPEFFSRLAKVKNAILVDRGIDTYELISRAKFVATITGTVGWESITGGKAAIVFGRPWYLTLPGVYHWPAQPSPERIAAETVHFDELKRAYSDLLRKGSEGVLDPAYRVTVDDYNPEKNTAAIVRFLRRVLRRNIG